VWAIDARDWVGLVPRGEDDEVQNVDDDDESDEVRLARRQESWEALCE